MRYKLKDIDYLIITFVFVFALAFISCAPVSTLMLIVLFYAVLACFCRGE